MRAALLALLLCACGASPVNVAARLVASTSTALEQAADDYDVARETALDRVQHDSLGQPAEARIQLVTAEADRWRPGDQAFDVGQASLATIGASIHLAALGGGGNDLLPPIARLAARVLALYNRVAEAVRPLWPDMPTIPSWIEQLATSATGGQ